MAAIPPEKLVRQFPTPNVSHGFFVERVASKQEAFKTGDSELSQLDIPIGTLHRDQQLYPGVKLVHVQAAQGDDDWVTRFWANDRAAADQDFFNYVRAYSAEHASYPILARRYVLPRDNYQHGTRGTPLTSLIGLYITSPGTGYTSLPEVVFTGTGTGAAASASVNEAGEIIGLILTNGGSGYTSNPAVSFVGGGGTGATAVAIIQNQDAILVKEEETEAPPELVSRYVVVNRIYETLPGPPLVQKVRSAEVRGVVINITTQRHLAGTVTPDSGDLVIQSVIEPQTAVVDIKRTQSADSLPAALKWAFWEYVSIPTLLFSITNTAWCSGTSQAAIITNYNAKGGSSVLRKHRRTVAYHLTAPNPNYSGSTYNTQHVHYNGRFINFSFNNVLNDAVNETAIITNHDTGCEWTETYNFPASSPSASTFYAGAWYVRSFDVEPWGTTGFRSVLIEFYSAPGNPTI